MLGDGFASCRIEMDCIKEEVWRNPLGVGYIENVDLSLTQMSCAQLSKNAVFWLELLLDWLDDWKESIPASNRQPVHFA